MDRLSKRIFMFYNYMYAFEDIEVSWGLVRVGGFFCLVFYIRFVFRFCGFIVTCLI